MMLVTAIFSYNRGQLLDNCVKSIELLCPESSVVIFDDGSDEPLTRETLRNIEARGHEVIISERSPDAMHGGLYRNMNCALKLARTRGWRLVHFMQEDTQFVRHEPRLEFELDRLFTELPDACQVTVHFWKTLSRGAGGSFLADNRAYRAASAICDIGVIHVERLLRAGFRFGPSEHEAAAQAASLGLSGYALLYPVIARVPWPLSYKYRAGGGRGRTTQAPLHVKPLDEHAIHRLMTRDVTELPYGESYFVPWGWRCWSPYPGQPSFRRWLRSVVALAVQGHVSRRLFPKRVGDLDVSARAVRAALEMTQPDLVDAERPGAQRHAGQADA